jgi:energy-coupling factor transporter ATP-binding protein EcfA2
MRAPIRTIGKAPGGVLEEAGDHGAGQRSLTHVSDRVIVPTISKAQVMALAGGDGWLEKGANLILFGPTGGGKSHLAAAIGLALVENGWRVLFARITELVQKLQVVRRELTLESAIAKLDKYHLVILDDLAYVRKDQVETSVLFELISARYEHRSLMITANQPFGEWGKVFPDQAMTRHRPSDSPRHYLRNECGKLPQKRGAGAQERARTPSSPRDNQDRARPGWGAFPNEAIRDLALIDAARQIPEKSGLAGSRGPLKP